VSAMTIEEIINGCKSKDRKCQQALYLLTAEDLMRVAQRYMKDSSAARDVFQEGYLKIFQKIHQFDSAKGSIGAWTGRIVANLAVEKLRSNKVISNIEDLPVALHPVTNESPLSKISADELLASVHQLPDSYRVIFLMNTVEGYSHKEIANKLDIKESTSRSQLVRAKAKLRSILQKKSNLNPKPYGQAK